MGRIFLAGPESSIVDLPDILRGFRFSLDAMWAEVSTLNLLKLVPALQMPVFFFLGRDDHWVPPETSVAYFDALTAPSKTLVWFEGSGHEPFADEPAKFNASMVELVRPVVVLRTAARLLAGPAGGFSGRRFAPRLNGDVRRTAARPQVVDRAPAASGLAAARRG
jgi:hypothetical protein